MSDDEEWENEPSQSCQEVEEESQIEESEQSSLSPADEESKVSTENVGLSDEDRKAMQQKLDSTHPKKDLTKEEEEWIQVLVKQTFISVAPSGHSGSVDISKALDILVRGKNKHMPKVDEEIWKMHVQLENIYEENKDYELEYNKGFEIIAKLWSKKDIKKAGQAFQKQANKKAQLLYLITLGTGYEKEKTEAGGEDEEEEEEEDDADEEEKKDDKKVEIVTDLTLRDVNHKVDELKQKIRWKNANNLSQCPVQDKGIRTNWTKVSALKFIKKAFDNAFQLTPAPNTTILYYSGSADENGNWKCTDGEINLKEVLDIAVEVQLGGRLEIHSDSDYSGKLCYQAQEWWAAYEGKDDEDNDIVKSLQMVCNTHKDNACKKGEHGQMYMDSKKEDCVKSKRESIKKGYYNKYGKTKFDSGKEPAKQIMETAPKA